MSKRILVWFRNDLRLHDNEVLVEAIAKSDAILPVFFFDPRQFERSAFGPLKTGANRTKFLISCVASLRSSLAKLGGNVLIRIGKPEDLLPALVEEYEINEVYHHREVASEETAVSTEVEDRLWKLKVNLKHFIGHTLYNKEDLPFPIKDIPDVFTQFKKKTERDAIIKPCFDAPAVISFVESEDWGELPVLEDLLAEEAGSSCNNNLFYGGEEEALNHLDHFLNAGEEMINTLAVSKKLDVNANLSAWIALGCLSPRKVYWKLKEAEQLHGLKPYFAPIILGLLWRDYFRFMFKKHGNSFFRKEGFKADFEPSALKHSDAWQKWKNGETGQEMVDAIMLELNQTGYINHTSRQLAAAYLIYELHENWMLGAAYFEEKLIDYCPASNWGNWANVAGVGNDQRLSSSFSFEKLLKAVSPKSNPIALRA